MMLIAERHTTDLAVLSGPSRFEIFAKTVSTAKSHQSLKEKSIFRSCFTLPASSLFYLILLMSLSTRKLQCNQLLYFWWETQPKLPLQLGIIIFKLRHETLVTDNIMVTILMLAMGRTCILKIEEAPKYSTDVSYTLRKSLRLHVHTGHFLKCCVEITTVRG